MPQMQKPIVFAFSKGGHTTHAAQALAKMTGAERVDLQVDRYSVPVFWMARGILDAVRRVRPQLTPDLPSVEGRPWVVVCGPIWVGQLAPPVDSLLARLANTDVPVALVTTSGDRSPPTEALAAARDTLGRDFVTTADLPNAMDGKTQMTGRLRAVVDALRQAASRTVA